MIINSLPKAFIRHYEPLVDNFQAFLDALSAPSRNSFRVNRLKATRDEVLSRFDSYGITVHSIDWYHDAYVAESNELSHTLDRFMGTIYIQELASMMPALVVKKELEQSTSHLTILDACAAPGSKTTQIAAFMRNRGHIVANDRNFGRIRALKFNLNKAGVINTCITNYELQAFPDMLFDIVLLDAPCSSDGTVRKNPELLARWSVNRLRGYSNMQKDLIMRAMDLVRPGGILVYSTCSLAPEENELVIDHLLQNHSGSVQPVTIEHFKFAEPVMEVNGQDLHPDIANVGRILPHHNDTDGFFVAKVKK